jgi:hypothetical protein
MIQHWEFGGIPAEWVEPMRDRVDEIWVASTWVRDCYVASGIPAEKVQVVPLGVDAATFRPDGSRFSLKTAKRTKFLFLGGTIHRKGIDILLEAYLKAFRAIDDVCLVIKGQSGSTYRGSELGDTLQAIRKKDPEAPEIEYLADSLDEEVLASLYRSCDVFVMPYRGEGFGLPMAEALASGLPVVATARGAAMDFLGEDRAYFIPSRRVKVPGVDQFKPTEAGFWLEEPDGVTLVQILRHVAAHPEERMAKGRRAREYAESRLGWERPVRVILDRLKILSSRTPLREQPPKIVREVKEAFLLRPDWSGSRWVEILLAFVTAFQPGEDVGLVFMLEGSGAGSLEAQEAIIALMTQTKQEQFPDVVLVDSHEDLMETLQRYDAFQWVPEDAVGTPASQSPRTLRLMEIWKALKK